MPQADTTVPPVFVEINPRVSKVFKDCDFGEYTGREIYPKALTLPVDRHGTASFWREGYRQFFLIAAIEKDVEMVK